MTRVDVAFDDVQAGDLVTLSYHGNEFTGKAWEEDEKLYVGTTTLRYFNKAHKYYKFVSASREVKLPTGIGAVIRFSPPSTDVGVYVQVRPGLWYSQQQDGMVALEVKDFARLEVLSEGVEID